MAERLKSCIYAGVLMILSLFMSEVAAVDDAVFDLQPGELFESRKAFSVKSNFKIFCYPGQKEHLLHMFQSAFLELNITADEFEIYEGSNVAEVKKQFEEDHSSWSLMSFWASHRSREIQLKPFNTTCIGIGTKQEYTVKLILLRISYYRLIMLFTGIFIFFMAPKLGRNALFHYLSGVSLGVLASFLILSYILSRMFPRKPIVYTILAGGWFVLIYMMNFVWDNMRHIAMEYRMHITGYALLSATISFIICYRMGPVTNPRTMDIIQWGLQAVGLGLVLVCSHFQEATIGLVILMLSTYNIPASWWSKLLHIWHRMFPPQKKLLTMEEYEDQGVRETEKALNDLRAYCSSPECNAWDLSLKLSNPSRYAKFVKGESHLNDEELMEYNVIRCQADELLTDDDDEDY